MTCPPPTGWLGRFLLDRAAVRLAPERPALPLAAWAGPSYTTLLALTLMMASALVMTMATEPLSSL